MAPLGSHTAVSTGVGGSDRHKIYTVKGRDPKSKEWTDHPSHFGRDGLGIRLEPFTIRRSYVTILCLLLTLFRRQSLDYLQKSKLVNFVLCKFDSTLQTLSVPPFLVIELYFGRVFLFVAKDVDERTLLLEQVETRRRDGQSPGRDGDPSVARRVSVFVGRLCLGSHHRLLRSDRLESRLSKSDPLLRLPLYPTYTIRNFRKTS